MSGGTQPAAGDPAPAGDATLAGELATAAGRLLLDLRARLGFDDRRTLRDEGDRRANELLLQRLADRRPGDAVLSEESPDTDRRLTSERVWIVDPLDGTREFAEPGRTDWAVHVALWEAGTLTAGAVALPALGRTFVSTGPFPDRAAPAHPLRLAVSRSRPPAFIDRLAARIGARPVPIGSAGMKAMSVLMGDVDAYVHAGAMHEWDTAAPACVCIGAGLHVGGFAGGPLTFNTPAALSTELVICHPALTERVTQALAELPEGAAGPG